MNPPGVAATQILRRSQPQYRSNGKAANSGLETNIRMNLGVGYMEVDTLKSFDRVERQFSRALARVPEEDRDLRGKVLAELGTVHLERAFWIRRENGSLADADREVAAAAREYERALGVILPADMAALATLHNQLGLTFRQLREFQESREHSETAIEMERSVGRVTGEARAHLNLYLHSRTPVSYERS